MNSPSSHDRLPWSCEAEQSVLGGLMVDNEAFARVTGLIDARSFWHGPHRQIFDAIAQHLAANKPADILTVFQTLSDAGAADDVGGLPYLNDLAQSVASAANIWRYAEIVADKALRRRILATVDRALEMDVARYVPGHGFIEEPAVSREELVMFRHALVYVIAEAERLHGLGLFLRGTQSAVGLAGRARHQSALPASFLVYHAGTGQTGLPGRHLLPVALVGTLPQG